MKRKRSAGYGRRLVKTRSERRKVWIVCEGPKTEKKYFESFRSQKEIRYANIEIYSISGKNTDPLGIVKYANSHLKEWGVDFRGGDGVWCVFDVDSNKDQILRESYDLAMRKNVQIALSNPCIELWFLIHYQDQHAGLERDQAKSEFKKFQPRYDGEVNNTSLNPLLPKAIERAKHLNDMHDRAGRKLVTTESNPSSQIFRLIEFIQDLVQNISEM
jgi:hypothetical protein